MSNELCRRESQVQLVLYFVTHFFELEHIHPSFFEVVEPIEVPIFAFCLQLIVIIKLVLVKKVTPASINLPTDG